MPALWNDTSTPPYSLDTRREQRFHCRVRRDVDLDEQSVDLLGGRATGRGSSMSAHTTCAPVGREPARRRQPDAASRAGDHRDLAVEPAHSRSNPRNRSQSVTAASNAASSTLAMFT